MILSAKYVQNEHYLCSLFYLALSLILFAPANVQNGSRGTDYFRQTTATSCSGAAGIMPARIWVVGLVSHVYLRNMALFLKGPPEEL